MHISKEIRQLGRPIINIKMKLNRITVGRFGVGFSGSEQ
jgi:hypothetical protein